MFEGLLRAIIIGAAIGIGIPILLVLMKKSKIKKAARIAAEEQQRKQAAARERLKAEQAEKEKRDRLYKAAQEQKQRETEEAIRKNPGSESYRLDHYESEVNATPLNITQFTPISKNRYVAFDLETTGINYATNQIVEIGAVRVENGEITAEFSQLINPDCQMPSEATAVNHITDNMLIGMPKIHQVLPAFLSFVGDDVLAAHNAIFDMRFLLQACMMNKFRAPVSYFDTMQLSRYWPDSPDKKLSSLISAAGIENDNAHRAIGDARAVAALISATNDKRSKK